MKKRLHEQRRKHSQTRWNLEQQTISRILFRKGFLALEEIDEAEFGLGIENINLENGKKKLKGKSKSKKGKISKGDGDERSVVDTRTGNYNTVEKDREEEKREVKQKKKTKKNKKTDLENNNEINITEKNAEPTDGISEKDNINIEENPIDEEEYYAWNELRLHPIIMKSIYRLKFKVPTPIQKACISAATHEGKDIIGAAETGSGKTLAFALPILQRLLDEQEKMERLMGEKGETNEKIAPRNVLRALIVTPTRELGLQVGDHIEEVAKGTGVRVV